MEAAYIFIDEFGNTAIDLSKQETFSHFVYASVIIKKLDLDKAEKIRNEIVRKFKLGNDIKSSNIKEKQFDKRLQILGYLINKLDFVIDVLVIDKSKIESEGLKYKRIFYKYFQSLYVSKYNNRYESFHIFADQVGEDFRKHLQFYVNTHGIQKDLFAQDRFFVLANDKNQKLIQLADFIVGCVGKIFCTSHAHQRQDELFDILKARLSIEYFPYNITVKSISNNQFDKEILQLNNEFLKKYYDKRESKNNSPGKRCLQYLYLQLEAKSDRFVPTSELLSYIQLFYPSYTKEKLRMMIRDMRYEGLFIVSHSGKSGYKLANTYNDVSEHFKHFMKHVLPMLQKVKILNEKISQSSFNQINLLEKDETLKQMKELVSSII